MLLKIFRPILGDLNAAPVGAKEHKNEIIAIVFGIVGGLAVFVLIAGGVIWVFEGNRYDLKF